MTNSLSRISSFVQWVLLAVLFFNCNLPLGGLVSAGVAGMLLAVMIYRRQR